MVTPFGVPELEPQELEYAMYKGHIQPGAIVHLCTTVPVFAWQRHRVTEAMKVKHRRFATLHVVPDWKKRSTFRAEVVLHVQGPAWQVALFEESLDRYRRVKK